MMVLFFVKLVSQLKRKKTNVLKFPRLPCEVGTHCSKRYYKIKLKTVPDPRTYYYHRSHFVLD